jgi:hypothetical protein
MWVGALRAAGVDEVADDREVLEVVGEQPGLMHVGPTQHRKVRHPPSQVLHLDSADDPPPIFSDRHREDR